MCHGRERLPAIRENLALFTGCPNARHAVRDREPASTGDVPEKFSLER
jgi:hypothetical protein